MAVAPQLAGAPPEANQTAVGVAQGFIGGAVYQPKDDPPVPSSGYWSPDESTGKPYWTNYFNTKPKSQADLEFYSLDRDELRRFQELAFQAGYYGSGAERSDIPFGSFDPKTYDIWQQYNDRAASGYKVGKNFTLWDYLQDDVNNRPESVGKSQKRAPLVTELPDPRAVEEMVRGVAPSVIGRDADPAFTQDFIAMYTKIVSEFQKNKYALQGTEEGGTITAPPSAEALAAFRLRTENPEQYEEKRSAARAQAYTSLLKGAL